MMFCYLKEQSREEISSSSKIRNTAIGLHVLSRNVLELGKGPHPCGSTSSVQFPRYKQPSSASSAQFLRLPKQPSSATALLDRFFLFRFIIAILWHLNLSDLTTYIGRRYAFPQLLVGLFQPSRFIFCTILPGGRKTAAMSKNS